MNSEIEGIKSQIEILAERVADLTLHELRENLDAGGEKASAKEKQLARARRSLEKAAHILSGLDY